MVRLRDVDVLAQGVIALIFLVLVVGTILCRLFCD